ncbi:hypothetical protein ON010_g18663 [Phytophthora cinnamomi]|nr:hypothetical protein ON010_g18663 [Phytophthora cinnamomi]
MLNVHRQKDIGEVAELPLITMVVNCHLWYVDAHEHDDAPQTDVFGTMLTQDHVWLRERQHVPALRHPALRRARRLGVQRCLLPLELGTETQTVAQVVFGGFRGVVPGLALLRARVGRRIWPDKG